MAPETVEIAARPAPAPSQEGGGATVELNAIDNRATYRDRVATKKNGYGVELARIKSSQSPLEIVRESMKQELQSKGFVVGNGGALVTIELLNFYSDFKPAFIVPTADSVAEVSFSLQVGPAGGSPVYTHIYRGAGTSTDAIVMTPGSARVALEHALAAAMLQVSADNSFTSALRTMQAAPASTTTAKPAAAPPTSSVPSQTSTGSSTPVVAPPPISPGQGLSRSRL